MTFQDPVSTFWDHAFFAGHDLSQKPVSTFWDHACFIGMIWPKNRFPLFGIMP
jgi:hypothetical protein